MKTIIMSKFNPNMFPALFDLALKLSESNHRVEFWSRHKPTRRGFNFDSVTWSDLPHVHNVLSKLPVFRSVYLQMLFRLLRNQPTLIIAQEEYLLPAIAYKLVRGCDRVRVVGYFPDYYVDGKGMALLSRLCRFLDGYIDVCALRLVWRKRDWPQMTASTFVVRNAPPLQEHSSIEVHSGAVRMVFTASSTALSFMNMERLSTFIDRICQHGIQFDWYLPGTGSMQATEQAVMNARAMTRNSLFSVRAPKEKGELMELLRSYDVGLFWAPLADCNPNDHFQYHYFQSAASHKIGEYLSSGLLVAHTGNPGLAFIPSEACIVFDPSDPIRAADLLASNLLDRSSVDLRRAAALCYHQREMNFQSQIEPLNRFLSAHG